MSNQQPMIHVIPQTALVDERVSITVTGLAPGQVVSLTSHMDDFLGLSSHWEAEARFQADARGTVDVSTQKPLSGDYGEVDQMGLFRFMKLKRIKKTTPPRRLSEVQFTASIPIHFTVQADGALLASATMTRRYMSEDVEVHPVLEEGVVGKVFYKRVDQPRPAIIIVGGSNGGLAIVQHLAALFASHGYVALAIAYFGLESLPEALSHIPVELVSNALHWLERQPMVDQDKIGIYGASKGGESVLLAASVYRQLHLVVAVVPSAFVFQGLAKDMHSQPPLKSSWTMGGQEVPFVPYKYPPRFGFQLIWKSIMHQDMRFDALYRNSIAGREPPDKAVIAVERINGPVLLVSAGDDAWWPSSLFTSMIVKRLQELHFPYEVMHLDYAEAGHALTVPYMPTTLLQFNGGTPKINAAAIEDAWRNILTFLNQHFAST